MNLTHPPHASSHYYYYYWSSSSFFLQQALKMKSMLKCTAFTVLAACAAIAAVGMGVTAASKRRQEKEKRERRLQEERENEEERQSEKARCLFEEKEEGDGNCLFRAVSRQVYGSPSFHFKLRQECVSYMETHSNRFGTFEDNFSAYLARMRGWGTWGGDLEIRAMEEVLDRNIVVHLPLEEVVTSNPIVSAEKIRVFYNGRSHYNSLIDPACDYPLPPRETSQIRRAREMDM